MSRIAATALVALLSIGLLALPASAHGRPTHSGPVPAPAIRPNVTLSGSNLHVRSAVPAGSHTMRFYVVGAYGSRGQTVRVLADRKMMVDTARGEPMYLFSVYGISLSELKEIRVIVQGINRAGQAGPRAQHAFSRHSLRTKFVNKTAEPACLVTGNLLYQARNASKWTLHVMSMEPIRGPLRDSKFRTLRAIGNASRGYTAAAGAGYQFVTGVELLTTGRAEELILQVTLERARGDSRIVEVTARVDSAATFLEETHALYKAPGEVRALCRNLRS